MKNKLWRYFALFGIALFCDRITKYAARLCLEARDVEVFPGFNLSLVYNRGVSFNMLHFASPLYFWIVTALVCTIFCIFAAHVWAEYKNGVFIDAEIFILSGAISNLVDRFLYGGVVDFLDFYYGYYHFPTFNIADVCIVLGVIFIAIRSVWYGTARKS
jgi:signal peptidase II